MNTKKATKRALLTSVMALVMCVVMLVGTTFAWFTDTASTGVNKIQAGNLDVKLEYKNSEQTAFAETNTNTKVFKDGALWEPGHVEYVVLKISNAGNLALKYKLGINIASETGSTNVFDKSFKLSDYIKFAVIDGESTNLANRDALVTEAAAAGDHVLNAGYTDEGHLLKDADKVVTLVVWMPTDVGNEANHKTGVDAPSIDLGINVVATQYTYEYDSYGNDYDAGAPYEIVKVSDEKELRTALFNAPTDGSGVKIVLQNDITLDMYYSALLFAHSNTADKWQHSGGMSAEDAAIEAVKPENNEVPDYSTAYDTLAHYKTAVNGWDTVSRDLTEQAKFGANFPMSATNPVARLVVKPGQDVIIDLNGKTIAKKADATHGNWSNTDTDIIANYGMLKIVDGATGGKVVGRGYYSCGGAVLHNCNGAIMTVEGVEIDGNAQGFTAKTGQYVVTNEGGKVVIDGANIHDEYATGDNAASLLHNVTGTMIVKGNATLNHPASKTINCKGGEVFVESATITSSKYAVYAKGGKVEVTDTSVTVAGGGTMTEVGGTIIHK